MPAKKKTYPQVAAAPVVPQDAAHVERLARCVPVAQEILKLIGDATPYMGEIASVIERDNHFLELGKEVLEIMLAHDIKYSERQFVFQLVLQPIESIKTIANASVETNFEAAMTKLFGKDIMEVSMSDLNNLLKAK